jgi:hypothetical protein
MLDIGANVARMQADMRNIVGTMESGFGRIRSLAQKVGITLSAAFVVHEAIQMGEQVLKLGSDLTRLSEQTSLSVETLSTLKYTASLVGVDFETLTSGVERLSKNMLEAQAGTGKAKVAFDAMGVSITDTHGNLIASDEMLGQLADRFAAMEKSPGKTALAMEIFGRAAGPALLPYLNKGSEGLADIRAELEKLGGLLDEKTAAQLDRISANFVRMHASTQGVAIAIMSGLIPTLENLTNIFLDLKNGSADFLRIGEGVAFIFKVIASAAVISNTELSQTLKMLEAFGGQIEALSWGKFQEGIKIWNDYEKQSAEAWTKTSGVLARIWDKDAENALKSADKIKKGMGKAPALPTEDEKAIEKILKKLQEEVEAMQMGSDALELYKKGLHEATGEQKDFALGLIRTVEAYEQNRKSILDRAKAIEEDQAAALENEKAMLSMVDAIRMHAITANMDEEEVAKFDLTLKGASKSMLDNVETYFTAIRAAQQYKDQIKLLEGVIEETKSPMDRYEERMREIQSLLDSGMISAKVAAQAQGVAWEKMSGKQEETNKENERLQIEFGKKLAKIKLGDSQFAINEIEREAAIFKNAGSDEVAVAIWAAKEKQKVSREWQDGAIRGLQDYAIVASDAAKNTEEVFTHAFKGMEDALVDFAKTGKLNFSKMIDSFITDLLRLVVRQTITAPLAAGLAGQIGSIFGGGGAAGQQVGNIGYQGTGYEAAGLFHGGGIIGDSFGSQRMMPAHLLISAPRYHGGLQPDEFPSILRRGEGVFTPEQMKAMGGQTNISIAIPVNASMDPRKAGQMRSDLESELEPAVRKIIARYV